MTNVTLTIMFRNKTDQANFLETFKHAVVVNVEGYNEGWVELTSPYSGYNSLDNLKIPLGWIREQDIMVQYLVVDVRNVQSKYEDELLTILQLETTLLKAGYVSHSAISVFKTLSHSMIAANVLSAFYVSDDKIAYKFKHLSVSLNQAWLKKP